MEAGLASPCGQVETLGVQEPLQAAGQESERKKTLQGVLTLALGQSGLTVLEGGGSVLCAVGGPAASLASTHQMSAASL